jgi:hypothetical protein
MVAGLLSLAACDPEGATAPPPAARDTAPPPTFGDASGLLDGTVVREDAAEPLGDAAIVNEAGVCRTGSVSGVTCAPSGDLPIPGARISAVTRDCRGREQVVDTFSDARGGFQLGGLAPGRTEVTITVGSFVGRFSVEVLPGADVFLSNGVSNKVCLRADAAGLAVLTGNFDSIEDRLDDLGFAYDLYCGDTIGHRAARQVLADWEQLRRYQVVFVNCATGIDLRVTNPEVEAIVENLERFVREGGSLYVSDLAADFVERVWPNAVDFDMGLSGGGRDPTCCVCTDCPEVCVVENTGPTSHCPDGSTLPAECRQSGGTSGRGSAEVVPANIVSPFLQSYLDSRTIDVVFDLGGWVQMTDVGPHTEVLVEAVDDGRPLMVAFEPYEGGGTVAYTSFHTHRQTTEPMKRILRALVFRL